MHGEDSLRLLADLFIRVSGAIVLFTVLLIGAYYAITAFGRIGAFIAQPGEARESIREMAELIDAERLGFQSSGSPERVEAGKLGAMLLWFVWHLLWVAIPLSLVSISGRILLAYRPPPAKRE